MEARMNVLLSFNMGWQILVNFIPRLWLGINHYIRQSMLKLKTHSDFHDLFLN